jgi:hypothetical protein
MFNADEISALRLYSSIKYKCINAYLRGEENLPMDCSHVIPHLDSAINKCVLKEDLTVYRGVNGDVAAYFANISLTPGDRFSDSAFSSTSINPGPAKLFAAWPPGGVILKIRLKAGITALDMTEFSENPDEHEMLLPRDMPLLVKKVSVYDRIIEMEGI